jgi:hypothetical protein
MQYCPTLELHRWIRILLLAGIQSMAFISNDTPTREFLINRVRKSIRPLDTAHNGSTIETVKLFLRSANFDAAVQYMRSHRER